MNIKKKININKFTLLWLVLFSIFIILILWLSTIFYYRYSYEIYQVKNMNQIANKILNIKEGSLNKQLESLAYKNEVCMEVLWNDGNVSSYNTLMVGCELNSNNNEIIRLQNEFLKSNDTTQTYRIKSHEYQAYAYLYGIKTNLGSIYLYSPLKDLSEVSKVLQSQLIFISFIAIIIASFIAYFLSKKLTNPILEITNKARNLGKGNYKQTYEESGIKEIDELANVLKNTQDELVKTDELRRDLMANVSHDLKTPLTMIKAYAEMVRDLTYQDDEKRINNCNVIMNETDRLNLLVNDILDLSKLEADVKELEITKYDLVKEVKEIIKRYEIIKETENYNFVLEMPNKAMVMADKNKLNQVIYNLINNAINHTGKDKTVTIRLSKKDNEYLFEVIDTGKGISEEEIPLIWNKYYKSEKKHQRNVVGTGIGLSIIKSILEKHQFNYGVKSKENKGSNFYFYIKSVK